MTGCILIETSGVQIQVIDRQARTQHQVVPREFEGQLLHQLPAAETAFGEIYVELYLNDPQPANQVGLYWHGTRAIEDIAALDVFQRAPWTAGCLQGIIDAPFELGSQIQKEVRCVSHKPERRSIRLVDLHCKPATVH